VVAEWERLAAEAPPFLRPAFFMATARWLSPPGDPVLLSAHQDGRLAAILPLVLHRGRLGPLRSLHTPRYDLLGDPGALAAMWTRLREDLRWHELELSGVPEDSALMSELVPQVRGDGFLVVQRTTAVGPYFPLAGFEKALSGSFRRKLQARRRKLAAVSFERVCQADDEALEDLFRLEAAAWKADAGTAISSSPATRGFYTELARRCAAAGTLTLGFLRAGGARIAAHFAVEDGRRYYLLKTGYDPDHARFGPGQLLVHEAAADARRRGLEEFDFLGQVMDWKLEWTDRVRRHVRLHIYRPSIRGRAAHGLRHVVRPALGRARRAVRRVRQPG
jgi:CelD/BcsL family acetyltransferase involved in cellulose biosynthesis